LNKEVIKNMRGSITSNDIESVMKNLSTKEIPDPDGFNAGFYLTFKEGLTTVLLKLFHKVQEKEILLNSFYKVSITLIQR
jgi:hypothetical protein